MTVEINRSLRLPESEYFPEPQAKSGIAIHHTVCDDAHTTLRLWERDRTPGGSHKRIGTAYVIDRDGTIYEAFDLTHWAWQFGLKWPDARRIPFEKRHIGIEIVSEGALTEEKDGRLYAYGIVSRATVKPRNEAFDCGTDYRGYRWFDRYEDDQLESLGRLVDDLCTRFSMPRVYPEKPFLYYGEALAGFNGVIGHAMVRPDKSDPAPDPRLWRALETLAGLKPAALAPPAHSTPMAEGELGTLFVRNSFCVDRMDVAAGSLVLALLMELERRNVQLRLDTPVPGAHAVGYRVVQGEATEVQRLGGALGFKTITDRLLEVHDA